MLQPLISEQEILLTLKRFTKQCSFLCFPFGKISISSFFRFRYLIKIYTAQRLRYLTEISLRPHILLFQRINNFLVIAALPAYRCFLLLQGVLEYFVQQLIIILVLFYPNLSPAHDYSMRMAKRINRKIYFQL